MGSTALSGTATAARLPDGVALRALPSHDDSRGDLTELFRAVWPDAVDVKQWNLVRSRAGVLRGVHVHRAHHDYLVALEGTMSIGLRDLRPDGFRHGTGVIVELRGDQPTALSIPPGVAHGFYFHTAATHVYGLSSYWDPSDELGCHWQDQSLEIPWPTSSALVSERDAALPPLAALLALVQREA